jgi:Domain of unknown function (DUF1707)/Cell wall-active antibiotics response 4TMS YvqF
VFGPVNVEPSASPSSGGPVPEFVPAAAPVPAPLPPSVRASDAEREAAVGRLSDAVSEGRLTLAELSERVESAYRATTRAELDATVADLPQPATGGGSGLQPVVRETRRRWMVSLLGEQRRSGRWRLAARTTNVSVIGETELDLREAVIDTPEVWITNVGLIGEHHVIVPPGVEVEVSGFVLLGSRHVDAGSVPPRSGAPKVHLRVFGLMGVVRVDSR